MSKFVSGVVGAAVLAVGLVVAAPVAPSSPGFTSTQSAAAAGAPAIAFTSQRDGGGLNQI
jgi:hypothetical protein